MRHTATNSLHWLADDLAALADAGLSRRLVNRNGPQQAVIQIDGQQLLNFGSNDYLGLANDARLRAAAAEAIEQFGWGSGASPLVNGHSEVHARLEERIAAFEQTEAALLFPSGFAANVGTVTALMGPDDVIFSDAKNHASIIDGCRLSGAHIRVYRHACPDHLSELLKQDCSRGRKLIVTDGLFSMDGDVAPLGAICELAERWGAMVMVDEAHATGVLGDGGRGTCEWFGVEERVAIRVGTLSKALGSIGGFVSGSQELIRWLINRCRPYIFSTAPPAAAAAAGLAALEIVAREPARRVSLLERSARLRDQLQRLGYDTGSSCSQIVPVIIGGVSEVMELSSRLRSQGIMIPGIRPPSVPEDQSLLRLSLCCLHDQEAVDRLLTVLSEPV